MVKGWLKFLKPKDKTWSGSKACIIYKFLFMNISSLFDYSKKSFEK